MDHFRLSLKPLTSLQGQTNLPLLIFLPGMDGTGMLYGTQIDELKHQFDLRCVVLPRTINQTWEWLVNQIAFAIRQEQYGERDVYVCGESFGGCLALLVALKAPKLIQRLILVNPATSFQQHFWLAWVSTFLKFLPEISYPLACNVLMPMLANSSRVDVQESSTLLSAMQSVGYAIAARRVELLSSFNLTGANYRQIQQPTLIISGNRDRLLPSVEEGYRLASLMPNAHLHILQNSGHACLIERGISLLQIMQTHQFGVRHNLVRFST